MIFLDIGSHIGQTLEEVVKESYGFEKVYGFEPARVQYQALVSRFSFHPAPNLRIFNYALGDHDGTAELYGSNDQMEASLFPGKRDVDPAVSQTVNVCDVARFFREYVTVPAVVKINCEGGEIAILERLISSGEIEKIKAMLVDFDAFKVPGLEQEVPRVRAELAAIGFDRYRDTWPAGETHQDRIANWLKEVM